MFDNYFSGIVQCDSNVVSFCYFGYVIDQIVVGQYFIIFGDGVYQVFMFFGVFLLWMQDYEVKNQIEYYQYQNQRYWVVLCWCICCCYCIRNKKVY